VGSAKTCKGLSGVGKEFLGTTTLRSKFLRRSLTLSHMALASRASLSIASFHLSVLTDLVPQALYERRIKLCTIELFLAFHFDLWV